MNSLPTDEPPILDSTVLDDPVVKPSGRSRFVGFIQVAAIAAFMVVAILFAQERAEPVAAAGADGVGSPVAAKAALSVKVQIKANSTTGMSQQASGSRMPEL